MRESEIFDIQGREGGKGIFAATKQSVKRQERLSVDETKSCG